MQPGSDFGIAIADYVRAEARPIDERGINPGYTH